MIDFTAIGVAGRVRRVKTITIGQPRVECPAICFIDRANGPILSAKLRGRCPPVIPHGLICDTIARHINRKLRVEIGEMENRRAIRTASFWPASRLKNQTPGLPPAVT